MFQQRARHSAARVRRQEIWRLLSTLRVGGNLAKTPCSCLRSRRLANLPRLVHARIFTRLWRPHVLTCPVFASCVALSHRGPSWSGDVRRKLRVCRTRTRMMLAGVGQDRSKRCEKTFSQNEGVAPVRAACVREQALTASGLERLFSVGRFAKSTRSTFWSAHGGETKSLHPCSWWVASLVTAIYTSGLQ